jgi:hypothetical protein
VAHVCVRVIGCHSKQRPSTPLQPPLTSPFVSPTLLAHAIWSGVVRHASPHVTVVAEGAHSSGRLPTVQSALPAVLLCQPIDRLGASPQHSKRGGAVPAVRTQGRTSCMVL